MPAKKQVDKEKVLRAGMEIVRERGMEEVNTFTLTGKLNCSTQPIYDSFRNMAQLKEEIGKEIEAVYERYLQDEIKAGKYPPYKCYGMGYIRFSREEKEFFRYLFLRDRSGERVDESGEGIREIVNVIQRNTGLDAERAYRFHIEMWIYVHGIASMLATSYLDFDERTVSEFLTDAYEGLKLRYKIGG